MTSTLQTPAIVTSPATDNQVQWKFETISLQPLGENDLLIDIVASGICHTDITASFFPTAISSYPKVLGHEGAGYVKEVGSNVTVAKVGDPVLLSFNSCSTCQKCSSGHPAYCDQFFQSNFPSNVESYKASDNSSVKGGFFGQSSFSKFAIAKETSIVNVSGLAESVEELKLFAPMGCGFQTGAASLINRANATPEDTVAVIGLGGVGMAALMAAKIIGCKTVIGLDIVPSRLELAKELGATAVINSADSTLDVASELKKLANGVGPSIVIDATGNPTIAASALKYTAPLGKLVFVGVATRTAELSINLSELMSTGKIILSSVEGDVVPGDFVPKMIKWYKEGRFPVEKLIKEFKAEDFQSALAGMKDGSVLKPVLIW